MNNRVSSSQYDELFAGLPGDFEREALALFRLQYEQNDLYRRFARLSRRNPRDLRELDQIPFLPISFFKTHEVRTGRFEPEVIFESSGTTGQTVSRHELRSVALYKESFMRGFELFYGPVSDYCIIGLLPAYLERKGSSLVFMVDELIRRSAHPQSGFYLYAFSELHDLLVDLEKKKQKKEETVS